MTRPMVISDIFTHSRQFDKRSTGSTPGHASFQVDSGRQGRQRSTAAVELSTRQVVDSRLTVVDSGRQFESQGSTAWRRAGARAADCWCAPVPGQGHVRGPDRGRSSILLPCAAWLVHPDPLPSWQAFSAPVSHLEGVCTVICKS